MKYRYVNQKRFLTDEFKDLLISTLGIGVAFTILYYNNSMPIFGVFLLFIISLLTAGAGFVLHELAHKYFAIKFGAKAQFVADKKMLLFAILTALIGFLFAAPGAVMISGNLTKKQYGLTSLAGPLTNLVLAILFYGISFILPIFYIGVAINAVLFAFNMLPIPPFDGSKVLRWNKTVYLIVAAVAVLTYLAVFFL